MKKLMILAAMAAVTGAFAAADCSFNPVTPTPVQQAAVWMWKFTGKTTVGTPVMTRVAATPTSDCGFGGSAAYTDGCVLRVPGTLAIQGYTLICDYCCDAFAGGTAVYNDSLFYMTKPYQAAIVSPTINIDFGHIIGRVATQYEVKGTATFNAQKQGAGALVNITFAGLGVYNISLGLPSSISGNFAGTLKGPYYVSRTYCAPADYWTCALNYAGDPEADTVAYGTWSAKYNGTLARRYLAGFNTATLLPSWAR